jgi:hypothetical protein
MADLVEPPSNSTLLSMSRALRNAPQKLAAASPVLGSLANYAREYLTEPMARGLESWAYGDRLLGAPANSPMVNSRTLDMLSALPLGAPASVGSANKAIFLPVTRAASPELRARAVKATQLWSQMQGQPGQDIDEAVWRQFGLIPTNDMLRPATQRGFLDKRFLYEVPDEKAVVDPRALEELRRGATDLRLGQVLRHPEAEFRTIADTPIQYEPGRGIAYFSPENAKSGRPDRIMVNDDFWTRRPGQQRNDLLHESNHAVQEEFGLPGGSNSDYFQNLLRPPAAAEAKLADAFSESFGVDPQVAPLLYELATNAFNSRVPAYNRYRNVLGERGSQQVELRSLFNAAERQNTVPDLIPERPVSQELAGAIPLANAEALINSNKSGLDQARIWRDDLVETLRNWGHIK